MTRVAVLPPFSSPISINLKTLLLLAAVWLSTAFEGFAQEQSRETGIHWRAELETNYGNMLPHCTSPLLDFPHLTLSGELLLPDGWSIVAELEHERFREDSQWINHFRKNTAVNKCWVGKAFSEQANLKAGVIDVPVGLVNSGHGGLTIYDPESEAALLPMTWHEEGIGFWGQHGAWRYEASVLSQLVFPLKGARLLGGAARIDCNPLNSLRVALSAYWGHTSSGMVCNDREKCFSGHTLFVPSLDFCFTQDGIICSGSVLYANTGNARSIGLECGYDLLCRHRKDNSSTELIPFVRFDGIDNGCSPGCTLWTAGLNYTPCEPATFKAEISRRNWSDGTWEQFFNIGICLSIGR